MTGGPCSDCFRGSIHDGNPAGEVTTIHGLPTYVAHPEGTPKGIIVVIPDAFGWEFVNNRVVSDHYAKRGGFLVYLPDFMNGGSLPMSLMPLTDKIMKPASWFTTIFYKPFYALKAMFTAMPWLIRCRPSVCKRRVFEFVSTLRTSPPPFPTSELKIGAAGFCWGGKHAILLTHDTPSSRVQRHESQSLSSSIEPLVDCVFTAHPSMVSFPKEIEAVSLPLSVAVGNEDMAMGGKDILKMKEILEVKKKGDHEVIIMPGAKHGFANRTDPKDEFQMECAEKAEVQAIEWFTRWFA